MTIYTKKGEILLDIYSNFENNPDDIKTFSNLKKKFCQKGCKSINLPKKF